ncbi:MAG: efflux RND transporter periplasmic adaptor subunit [Methylophilaceae bacterium]
MQKIITILILTMLFTACGNKPDEKDAGKNEAKPTLVTVAKIKNQAIETVEESVGTLEGLIDATVAAEVVARVIKVHVVAGEQVKQGQLLATLDASDFAMQRNEAQAEIARIQALLENQAKVVARNQALVDKKFISQNAVDTEVAQQKVLKEQLEAAKARVGSINHSSSKSRVVAPVSGTIEKRLVGTGDFVRIGDPIVQIVSTKKLRAHLPFPEQIATQLKQGQLVRLSTPTSKTVVETVVHELKPMITEGSRSVDVIADVADQVDWQPGATVTGVVVLGEQPSALMIPEQSLVLRPAGEVAYVVRDGIAHQAVVKSGQHKNGMVEVLEGLKANDTIVVDGAGFLTDKAPVKVSP